jgi:hypothetical protein
MAGNNSENISIGQDGTVSVATWTGSLVYPETLATALNASFEQIGYLTTDGFSFTVGSTTTDIAAFQSLYPVEQVVTAREASVAFTALEYNEHTLTTALGGTIAKKTGFSIYVPPAPSSIKHVAVCFEWVDQRGSWRFVIPRGVAAGSITSTVNRTSAAELPITITATPKGDPVEAELKTQPYYLIGPEGIATT